MLGDVDDGSKLRRGEDSPSSRRNHSVLESKSIFSSERDENAS